MVLTFLEQKINLHFTKKFKNKVFCGIVMSSGKYKILEFKHDMKSNKMPYIICADFKFFIKKYMDVKIIKKNIQQEK